jgi:2-amino-1-hydroxyethylphosphonate dioxygenase (glycine-forming)
MHAIMGRIKAQKIADEVFSLYEKYGNEDYIGEPVSQLEHMCQAAQLAEAEGYEEEVILAAFFHDIGHLCEHIIDTKLMDGYGVMDHEIIAGNYLRQKGFSKKMTRLVESHVQAKRYLTFKYPDYYDKLSEASRITLTKQGGVMVEAEAKSFETDPLHSLYIKLREWDDKAKLKHQTLPSLDRYKEMAIRHLLSQDH